MDTEIAILHQRLEKDLKTYIEYLDLVPYEIAKYFNVNSAKRLHKTMIELNKGEPKWQNQKV